MKYLQWDIVNCDKSPHLKNLAGKKASTILYEPLTIQVERKLYWSIDKILYRNMGKQFQPFHHIFE